MFNSFFHDFFTDPFFRTSTTAASNVRRVAELMDSMVLDSKAPCITLYPQMGPLQSPSGPRLTKKRPAHVVRQGTAIEQVELCGLLSSAYVGSSEDKGSIKTEDELWRNSLRRFSPKNSICLPAITSPVESSRSPMGSSRPAKALPTNQNAIRNVNPRRKALTTSQATKSLQKLNANKPKPLPSPTERPNEELVTQISTDLGCERYLVEMVERDVLQKKPNVGWESIAGLKNAKELLQEAVILPNIVPDYFKGIRRPWKGVLLVGPPGTGKTLLAKAVASECKSTFFNVTSSTLTSKYRGESEKLVKILFRMARKLAPSIIFIDEVDALVAKRSASHDHEASRRFQSELLVHMDGLQGDGPDTPSGEQNILVLAASNHPWFVDEAFRRRFEKRIYIPLPDGPAREEMLRLHLDGVTLDPKLNLTKIAKKLEGYSGADIMSVCRDASLMGLRRKVGGKSNEQIQQLKKADIDEPVTTQDFLDAIKRCRASVSSSDIIAHENWIKEFGSF